MKEDLTLSELLEIDVLVMRGEVDGSKTAAIPVDLCRRLLAQAKESMSHEMDLVEGQLSSVANESRRLLERLHEIKTGLQQRFGNTKRQSA